MNTEDLTTMIANYISKYVPVGQRTEALRELMRICEEFGKDAITQYIDVLKTISKSS